VETGGNAHTMISELIGGFSPLLTLVRSGFETRGMLRSASVIPNVLCALNTAAQPNMWQTHLPVPVASLSITSLPSPIALMKLR
jgi:hypothetical protein